MKSSRVMAPLAALSIALIAWPVGITTRNAGVVEACGPFVTFPMFTDLREPDDHLAFVRGNLGVIHAGYRRRYLVGAWRVLEGEPLTPRETEAFVPATASPPAVDAVNRWVQARNATPGVPPLNERPVPQALLTDGGRYTYITNCGDDAFTTAAATLADRRARSSDGPSVRQWVRAQDMVFANCARRADTPPAIPPALDAGADPGARADRAYQIAAAHFYAGRFADAERAFAAIAADPASPWRTLAPYLAARAVVRQGTLGGTPPDGDRASLERAERLLDEIIGNPRLQAVHDPAWRLRQFVRSRLRPLEVLDEVAAQLQSAGAASDFAARLADLDYMVGWRMASLPDADAASAAAPRPLLEWIAAVQGRWRDPAVIVSRWRATQSPAWLVAALMSLPHDATGTEDVLSAAVAVEPTSAAFPTVAFHRARILIRRGRFAEARAVLSTALALPALSPSTVNLLKGARFLTARTLDEFVEDGARNAIGEVLDVDEGQRLEHSARRDASFVLDRDVIAAINERMPVGTLQRLADHPRIPRNVRRELLRSIFVRLWLLGRLDDVRALLPALRQHEPRLGAAFARLDDAGDERLNDELALLMLGAPGLRPYVAAVSFRGFWQPYDQPDGLTGLNGLRDNWWCGFGQPGSYYTSNLRGVGAVPEPLEDLRADKTPLEPAFLSEPERQLATDEHARLAALDSGSNEIARRVIDWARRNPRDPRVPESLHRVVRGLRLGCGNEQSGDLSREAFQLLHRRYANTTWAARTPYWYR